MRQIAPEHFARILGIEGISRLEVVASKKLPYSTVTRLNVEYSANVAAGLPGALFLKVSEAKEARAEVEFYSTPARSMACPPLVRCIAAAYPVEEAKSYLLFEDLTETHEQP